VLHGATAAHTEMRADRSDALGARPIHVQEPATIRMSGDGLRIEGVFPGSGAEAAGLAVGDLIVAIDGVPVANLGATVATDRIRGTAGTRVTLTVRRDGHDAQRSVERRQLRS